MESLAVIILAAGKGTRMKSDLAKVLHKVAGNSMVIHVVQCATALGPDQIHVVVGHQAEQVKMELAGFQTCFAHQKALLGTGDAVKAALPGLARHIQTVLVLCGDVPLIKPQTLRQLLDSHLRSNAVASVLAVNQENPRGYGRIVTDDSGRLTAIREEADASDEEKRITLVNSGIYCFEKGFLEQGIGRIKNTNEQAEYYLTDLVEIAVSQNETVYVQILDDPVQVMGVNTPSELARAEALFQEEADELP